MNGTAPESEARVYIAEILHTRPPRYVLRASVRQPEGWSSRDVLDLGTDPGRWIVYPGGHAFYVDPEVEARIASSGLRVSGEDLENVFWRFVHPEVRRVIEPWRERRPPRGRTPEAPGTGAYHLFDRRRIHFLRYGQMDQGHIGRVSPRLFRMLEHRSRDEIEQYFLEAEGVLRARERKAYLHVIFDLQRFFSQACARSMPEGLDPEALDRCFLEELCRLQGDEAFWAGMPPGDRLRPYLVRYAIMYFDHDFPVSDPLAEIYRRFMDDHRRHRPPPPPPASLEQAEGLFGAPPEALRRMSRQAFTRLFRRKAMELHPDRGGRHLDFVRLAEIYREIVRTKR
jgi:hypothetical protein